MELSALREPPHCLQRPCYARPFPHLGGFSTISHTLNVQLRHSVAPWLLCDCALSFHPGLKQTFSDLVMPQDCFMLKPAAVCIRSAVEQQNHVESMLLLCDLVKAHT